MESSVKRLARSAISDAVARLVETRMVTEDRANEIATAFKAETASSDPSEFAQYLSRTGLLTQYQAERLLTDEWTRLILGPYLILEPHSSGTLGTIFRALDREHNQLVSLNVLPLRSIWHVHLAKKVVSQFREIPPHPGVVPLIDIDTANGVHYLCWPYSPGETIERRVTRRGPLSAYEVLRYATTFAEAIANCHRHGIVHGCIHPGNLLVGHNEATRVIEWGAGAILSENIADDESFLDTISSATSISQNIDYIAPETIADPTHRSAATDQYAFGCSLYFALTANGPFPEGNFVDKMIAHQTKMPEPLHQRDSRIPEPLSQIVQRLMSKSPADRYADWQEPISLLRMAAGMLAPNKDAAAVSSTDDVPEQIQWDQLDDVLNAHVPASVLNQMTARPDSIRDRRSKSESDVTFDLCATDEDTENSFGIASGRSKAGSTGELAVGLPLTPVNAEQDSLIPPLPESAPVKPIVLTGRFSGSPKDSLDEDSEAPAAERKSKKSLLSFKLPSPIKRSRMPSSPEESDAQTPLMFTPKRPRWRLFYLLRSLLFRIPAPEILQISLFGPSRISAGQTIRLQAFAHSPATFESSKTLARAFMSNSELLVTGYADRFVTRGETLTLHLTVDNAGVGDPTLSLVWSGQSFPSPFDVHIPWENQTGVTSAVLSTTIGNQRTSTLPFHLVVESRVASRI